MRVEVGYTQESNGQWHKFMVELDENDLARMLYEVGLPLDTPLTSVEAFSLVMAEANRFSHVTRLQAWPHHPDNDRMKQELAAATQRRTEILNTVRARTLGG